MSNGPVVGQMHQGSPIAKSAAEPVEGPTPHRAAPAGSVPRGEQHQKETPTTVGRNGNKPR